MSLRGSLGSSGHDYEVAVDRHKNAYWRSKCWAEVCKQRRSSKEEGIGLLYTFQQYDRWEMSGYHKVDWKEFFEEISAAQNFIEADPDIFQNPKTVIVGAVLILLTAYFMVYHSM